MPTRGANRRAANRVPVTPRPVPVRPEPIATPAPSQAAPRPTTVQLSSDDLIQLDLTQAPGNHRFWLVQRLEQRTRPNPRATGFDALFEFDYMGSAEFEFGSVPQSLKRIRAAGELVAANVELTYQGIVKTVYFIGPRAGLAEKIADFDVWLNHRYLKCKEWTNFDRIFSGDYGLMKPKYVTTEAWWSLDDDITWTFKPEIAAKLLRGLRSPA